MSKKIRGMNVNRKMLQRCLSRTLIVIQIVVIFASYMCVCVVKIYVIVHLFCVQEFLITISMLASELQI